MLRSGEVAKRRSGQKASTQPLTYARAGVHVNRADRFVERIQASVRSTRRPEVLKDPGQFGGLFALRGYRQPVLVSSTDGVGTKMKLAEWLGRWDTIGVDLVAMNVNDVLTFGAQPLFFLDYLACGGIQPRPMAAIVQGIARGCRESNCALLGGETAEMPLCYAHGEYELAGFCVGAVERQRMVDGRSVRPGDVILGLASSGVHANGFSLVHRVFTRRQLTGALGRQLLTPTRIYVRPVLSVLRRARIQAMAHVTGGGLHRRLQALTARAATRCAPELHLGAWPIPGIFRRIQSAGRITWREMFRTFNMGIGMALVCAPAEVRRTQRLLRQHGVTSWVIGGISKGGA